MRLGCCRPRPAYRQHEQAQHARSFEHGAISWTACGRRIFIGGSTHVECLASMRSVRR